MTSINSNIKLLCEDFISHNNDELLYKIMNKLLHLEKVSEKFQKDVFINLTDKGLLKLFSMIKDHSEEIRKLACRVLIELLYNNEVLQNIFCEKFNFNPIGNVICINWLPKYLKENLTIDEKIINELKNTSRDGRRRYWMWPDNSSYTDDNFPDPQKYFVGFYYANKNVTQGTLIF